MLEGYFVTGTDTGVGKTLVSAILALGLGFRYWKPIQTGDERDSDFIRDRIGDAQVLPETFRSQEPVSPHLAAAAEGCVIDLAEFTRPKGPIIVEGAGGILVPLNDTDTMVDLARRLGLPVIVVVARRLGMINQTLLTLEALEARDLPVAGVVFSGEPRPRDEETILRRANRCAIGDVPILSDFSSENLRRVFRENFHVT